jgi:multidrug efflux system membrane fusion protein
VILLAAVPALASCGHGDPPAQPPTPVRVVEVQVASGGQGLRYSASIEARAQVPLSFQSSGQVKEILLFEEPNGAIREIQQGDFVAGGTLLARIDESEYQDKVRAAAAQVSVALAALEKGKADFKRSSILFETKSVTAPEYDTARKEYQTALAQVQSARSQLDEAELALEYCTLAASWDGVILQRKIEVGQLVDSQVQAFTLADVSSVKAVFGVPDLILKDVRIGTALSLRTESFPNRTFRGRVTAVSPAADSQSRVFQAEVTLPNPNDELKIGMIGSLVLPTEQKASAVLPLEAIVRDPSDPEGYAVYTLVEKEGQSIAKVQRVELGLVRGDEISVVAGVVPGERVIANGATRVVDGKPVRVIP